MISRRLAIVVLAAAAVLALSATSGFSVATADRSVEVAVAPDEDAYLGIADEVQCGVGKGHGNNREIVKNRLATTLDTVIIDISVPDGSSGALRVSNTAGGPFERLDSGDSTQFTYSLGPGEGAMLQVQPPTGNTTAADSLDIEAITAEGDGVAISVNARTVDVDCPVGN